MSRGQGRVYKRPGSAHWWLDYGVNGNRHRESSETTSKAEAQDLLRRRIGDRKEGRLIGQPNRVTLQELVTGLETHYRAEDNSSWTRAAQAAEHLTAHFGAAARALAITKGRVSEYIAQRLERGAARATVRYEIAILNTAFSVAVEHERLAVRPFFKLPKVENARAGFFEDGEFAALLLDLPAHVRHVVQFLRLTGWRKGEALELTWDAVDWEGQVLRLRADETKGRAARVFPFSLAPDLKALLEARRIVRRGVFVFHEGGQRIPDIRSQWRSACLRAGLATRDPQTKRVTLHRIVHDLRRTAARDYRRAGLSEGEIMRLCGWETRAMFDRYNIIDEQDLAQAVAKRFSGNGTGLSTGAAQSPAAGDPVSPFATQ